MMSSLSLDVRSWGRMVGTGAVLAAFLGVLAVSGGPAAAQEPRDPGYRTLDDEYADLADRYPGFGGLFLDETGATHVYLQDLALAREVQELAEGGVQVHQGRYDYRSLNDWKVRLRPLLNLPGAVFLDIDERANGLVLGITGGSGDVVERALRESGVPREAVVVEDAEPIAPLEELTDRIRPVPAGVRIRRVNPSNCTLGANATRLGAAGFVTASHCSAAQFVTDGTVFHQNNVAAGNRIGVEVFDPPFFVGGGCPSGRLCRYSDASFVAYDSGATPQAARIANPIFCSLSAGPLTVLPALPRRVIDLPVPTFVAAGGFVHKVGQTTGCTYGAVKNSCVDSNVNNSPFTLLCQTRVAAIAQGGDSGSPVFVPHGNEATFAGILWGGTSNTFVYSPWIWVQSELGAILSIQN
jgi:hypothetical protein